MSEQEESDSAELVLDIEELRIQLNLPENTDLALLELSERHNALNMRFGELLVYMNLIDERIQRLDGEPVVSTTISQHVGQDGTAQVYRMRPEAPAIEEVRNPHDLAKEGDKSALAKMVVSQ